MRFTPEELAAAAGGHLARRGTRSIARAYLDTRVPVEGGIFVPIRGARDGHDFVGEAMAQGAGAILMEPGYAIPTGPSGSLGQNGATGPSGPGSEGPPGEATVVVVPEALAALERLARRARASICGPVVAVTGSNGKTTSRTMISAVLRTGFATVLETRGNLNNHLGVPLSLLDEPHDPSAAVLELGMSAPGENDHLARLVQPTISVVTSVALEHLAQMGNLEAIARAEAEPFAHLPVDGLVVVPGDEPRLTALVPRDRRLATFAAGPEAKVRVVSTALRATTLAVLRIDDGRTVEVELKLHGAHQARNAACALTIGLALGLELAPMVRALEAVLPVGDRGRVVQRGNVTVIADCYNANPGSMEAALTSLAATQSSGLRLAVLGDMLELGDREEELHADLGRHASTCALDHLVTVGSRARCIGHTAQGRGLPWSDAGDDPAAAAAQVAEILQARGLGGVVLVKGSRGARMERVVSHLLGHLDALA